jgi:16S rRNA (guanine527-N7)-methyltransferase
MFLVKHRFSERGVGVLAGLLRELGRPASMLSPLLAHAHAVYENADRLGLVSVKDLPHLLTRHSADSMLFALARAPASGERWADVGSGAGFPGLVLAICYPEADFVLIEPQQRRAGFLDVSASDLGLGNVQTVAAQASSLESGFDVVTARALARPEEALAIAASLVRPGGVALVATERAAPAPGDARLLDVHREGVDSPGCVLMMTRPEQGVR